MFFVGDGVVEFLSSRLDRRGGPDVFIGDGVVDLKSQMASR